MLSESEKEQLREIEAGLKQQYSKRTLRDFQTGKGGAARYFAIAFGLGISAVLLIFAAVFTTLIVLALLSSIALTGALFALFKALKAIPRDDAGFEETLKTLSPDDEGEGKRGLFL